MRVSKSVCFASLVALVAGMVACGGGDGASTPSGGERNDGDAGEATDAQPTETSVDTSLLFDGDSPTDGRATDATADAKPTSDAAGDGGAKPAPLHVMTADYWLPSAISSDCKKVAPYLTYIYPKSPEYAAYHACGIKTVLYISPSMPQKGETDYTLMSGTYASASAKDCKGVVSQTYAGTGLLMDPHASQATAYYQATIDATVDAVKKENGGVAPDAIFSDNSDSDYGATPAPCDWIGFEDWTKATKGVLGAHDPHGAQLFLNALTLPEAYSVIPAGDTVTNIVDVLKPTPVTGGEQEGFVYGLMGHPDRWAMELNTQIATLAEGKVYWAYSNGDLAKVDPTSSSGIATRMYLYASFLLTYDPDLSIFQEWFDGTPSSFKVMPETGFVPTAPVKTAKTDVSELQVTGGAYVREFGACHQRGALVGACAVVVNPSPTAKATISLSPYKHSVVLTGSDILDGGTVTFDGPAVTELAPQTAAILLP